MANTGLSITLKTPSGTYRSKDSKKAYNQFGEKIEEEAVNLSINSLASRVSTATNRTYVIMATFFQRLCARTPLDEKYTYMKDGKKKYHTPDEDQCRMDWYIKCNGITVRAKTIVESYPSIFDNYNDKDSIETLKGLMKVVFGDKPPLDVVIGNTSKHFDILEYGGYESSDPHSPVMGDLYEHGIENKRSIQAPAGMLRITEMELESIVNNSAKTALSKRYKEQRTYKKIPKQKLKYLVKKFKSSRKFDLKDIQEYLDI